MLGKIVFQAWGERSPDDVERKSIQHDTVKDLAEKVEML